MSARILRKSVRKRQAELQRVLLPDAPPRKTPARRPSPKRDICPMMDDPLPSASASCEPQPQLQAGPRAEPKREPEPEHKHIANIDLNDKNIETTLDDWLLDDNSDIDFDVDTDNSPILIPRNAATEPACDIDMNELEMRVLQTEDELDDRVLRDIVQDDDYLHFDWKKDSTNFTGQRDIFMGTSGPTFDVTDKTPVDIFYKIFDTDFIDRICTETNRYAEQKIASLKADNKLLPSSRLLRWAPTDRDEIITFLAVLILQGLYPLPEEEKYFSFNGFGTMPYFSRIISYNRFILLKTLYHFVDNQTLTKDKTKLCKIQPVLDHLNEKFSTLYMPAQEIVIDESLLKWHGRLSFSQKIATKAAQVGIKTYELCESHSGYLWNFFVYVGKKHHTKSTAANNDRPPLTVEPRDQLNNVPVERHDEVIDKPNDETVDRSYVEMIDRPDHETIDRPDDETIDRPDDETVDRTEDKTIDRRDYETAVDQPDDSLPRPTNATSKIVFDLVEPLLGRGHTLIMDNFYNSPLLLRCLKKQKTDCYGTLRLNRQFVPDSLKTMTKGDLRQGEIVTTYSSDLSLMVWRDSNLVSMISTYHHLQVGTQNKNNRVTYKPKIVLDYNKSMGGVDRKDRFLSAHPVERLRNKVWYKKVFCRLLSTAVFNAFVIFSSKNPKISHREFRTVLAEDLLKRHRCIDLTKEPRLNVNRSGQLTTRTNNRITVDHDHFPGRSNFKKARCWMCKRLKRNTRTTWKCIECDVSLCIEHCFREYHKIELARQYCKSKPTEKNTVKEKVKKKPKCKTTSTTDEIKFPKQANAEISSEMNIEDVPVEDIVKPEPPNIRRMLAELEDPDEINSPQQADAEISSEMNFEDVPTEDIVKPEPPDIPRMLAELEDSDEINFPKQINAEVSSEIKIEDAPLEDIVKPEPPDIPRMLAELGDGYTAAVFDIEDPDLVIEISDSSELEN